MLKYTIHADALARPGLAKTVPLLSPPIVGEDLALGATSAKITGACEVRLRPDEDVRLGIAADPGDPDAASSPLVLSGGAESWFELPAGSWRLKAVAA